MADKLGANGATDFKRIRFVDEMMKLEGSKEPAQEAILGAYHRAGYSAKDVTAAYKLLRDPDIQQAISERRQAIGRRLDITAEKLLRDLEVLKFKAAAAGQYAAAVRCVELQARYVNAFPNQDPLDRLGAGVPVTSADDEPRFTLRHTARLILFELQVAMREPADSEPASDRPALVQ